MDSLVHEFEGVVEQAFLQVNAPEIVHAAAQLLPVLQIFEHLLHFVIVE